MKKSGSVKDVGGLKRKYKVAFLPMVLMFVIYFSTEIIKATYYPVIADVVIIVRVCWYRWLGNAKNGCV